MDLAFHVTGNRAFDLFIVQSAEYTDKVAKYVQMGMSVEDVVSRLGLTRADFTDLDWKKLKGMEGPMWYEQG